MFEEMNVRVKKTRRGLVVSSKSVAIDFSQATTESSSNVAPSPAPPTRTLLPADDLPDIPGYNEFTFDNITSTRRKTKVCSLRIYFNLECALNLTLYSPKTTISASILSYKMSIFTGSSCERGFRKVARHPAGIPFRRGDA